MNGNKVKRPQNMPPKCNMCQRVDLSDRNILTLNMYRRHKHFGLDEHERQDSIVRQNMIIIADIEELGKEKRMVSMMHPGVM